MRRRVVAGNWKMNVGPSAGREFVETFEAPLAEGLELILFPPALTLAAVAEVIARPGGPPVHLGVQNVFHQDSGAFTGENSVPMAVEAGARYVLAGHSERRHLFGESDDDVRRKVEAVLRHGLVPLLCVGETLDERRADRVEDVVLRQLDAVLQASAVRTALEGGRDFVVAYEPVWAIGTGETATPADASHAHGILRERLVHTLGRSSGERVPLLYGGSVKPDNASELMEASEVNGVLVGGASLDPDSFAAIAAAAG
ncbi:MAG: triose-phosphate isomerase [bacterium]